MGRTDVAKVLIFNEQMNCVLLMRDEALVPLGGILHSPALFQEVQRLMTPLIGIQPTAQPYWWHIRTEAFPSADTYMHIFFGKVSLEELNAIARFNPMTTIYDVNAQRGAVISHRLKYLIPMAIVLSSIDSRHWPKP